MAAKIPAAEGPLGPCALEAVPGAGAAGSREKLVASIAANDMGTVRQALGADPAGALLAAADPATGSQALHIAVMHGSYDVAAHILEVFEKERNEQKHLLGLRMELVERRARSAVDGPNREGRSPLAELLRRASPREELVVRLIGASADISRRDEQGVTPFLHCVAGGHTNIARLLVKVTRGLSLYDADDAGRLPLHCAAAAGHREVAEMLLRMKADPDARSADGLTARGVAESSGQVALLELLRTATEPEPENDGGVASPENDGEAQASEGVPL